MIPIIDGEGTVAREGRGSLVCLKVFQDLDNVDLVDFMDKCLSQIHETVVSSLDIPSLDIHCTYTDHKRGKFTSYESVY